MNFLGTGHNSNNHYIFQANLEFPFYYNPIHPAFRLHDKMWSLYWILPHQFFYLPNLDQDDFEFSEEESKHCIRVLRKKKGDQIQLIDGKGTEALAEIVSDNPKKCSGQIVQRILHKPNRNYHLHLAIAPTKNFDRMEWMLEKCIEIGVDEISFIITANSERDKINLERCEKIAIAAIKQSKQF
jgi:16S rRNA (uracil1498-N3)-methyltransferase